MADQGLTLTPNETKLLAYAWQCMEGDPKIDFDKLAPMCGYTVGSAKVTFGRVKRRMKAHAAGEPDPTTPRKKATAGTPKSTGKRKGAEAAGDGGTPSKKRTTGKKVKAEEDDEEEFADLKIVKKEEEDVIAQATKMFAQGAGGYGPGDEVV